MTGIPRPARRAGAAPRYQMQVEQMLAAVGLGMPEARVYALLLEHPGRTRRDLATLLDMPLRRVQATVGALETHGLVSRTPDRRSRYLATPPDTAVPALVGRLQAGLEQACVTAAKLAGEVRRSGPAQGAEIEAVELLTGREAVARRFQQLEEAAAGEILAFDCPPYYEADPGENPAEVAVLARGVSHRAVYAPQALEVPGRIDHIRAMAGRGEQARTSSSVPLKLFIFDRRQALLPVHPYDPDLTAGALLVRTCGLLDALVTLFELVWDRAIPIPVNSRGPAPPGPAAADDLILLLAAGLTDKAIAHRLGISRRTFQRRIAELMKRLGAENRFQAGYHAGLQGAQENPEAGGGDSRQDVRLSRT